MLHYSHVKLHYSQIELSTELMNILQTLTFRTSND